ncbi:MAG: DUF4132 domain-containing protein [Fimbriimonadaceae bacterium]|nr:DUF4132 domain-containing protein [Fimbriimonadaceae bacterium]
MTPQERAIVAVELAEALAPIRRQGDHDSFYTCIAYLLTPSMIRFDEPLLKRFLEAHTNGYLSAVFEPRQLLAVLLRHQDLLTPQNLKYRLEQLRDSMVRAAQQGLPFASSTYFDTIVEIEEHLNPDQLVVSQPWQQPLANRVPGIWALARETELKSTAPTDRWLSKARTRVEDYGIEEYAKCMEEVVSALATQSEPVPGFLSGRLSGLIAAAATAPASTTIATLIRTVAICGHKLSGIGARSKKGFSTAVWALSHIGTREALAGLSQAKAKIKTPSLASELITSLSEAASRQGTSLDELEELVVPTFGLSDGRITYEWEEFSAVLEVTAMSEVTLNWSRSGRLLAAPPQALRDQQAEDIREIKTLKKAMESALSAQRQRLDGLFLSRREIPYEEWVDRYWKQPLIQSLVERLIWAFRLDDHVTSGMPRGDKLLDASGKPFEVPAGSHVTLWHPLSQTYEEVEAWRNFLFDQEVTQPFKQAFRETYVLTPAEVATETYSNRFAAQVLRQHQMAALARTRGWRYSLQGGFDSESTPTLVLRDWNYIVEYFVTPAIGDEMSESGISLLVATDQVRFQRGGENQILASIPAIVFSEVMRDVDLFVGVAGIGNDPNWLDRGDRPYQDAWHGFAFGDLTAQAETRRDVLARLLPRLSIASVSRIEGKFLIVQGRKHRYKIHLGSGNSMIGDRYLCIVAPPERQKSRDFLPFEGDRTLSIILSKAFMLAADDKIKDPTILRQFDLE